MAYTGPRTSLVRRRLTLGSVNLGPETGNRNKDRRIVGEEADRIVHRIAAENNLPLEDSKHEKLVLRNKRRKTNKDVRWVKWLGIIMDESLTFKEHWKARILKARAMLAQFKWLGSSISASSWRQIYTGMVCGVALWGLELGWRVQRDWEKKFEQLQYQALKKCVNATHGSRIAVVSQIAGVESPRMALDAPQARHGCRIMRDTTAIGDLDFEHSTRRNIEAGREWTTSDKSRPSAQTVSLRY